MCFFGTLLLLRMMTTPNYHGGDGAGLHAVGLFMALCFCLLIETIGLAVIHVIGKKIAIPLVLVMLAGALFSIMTDDFEFSLAMFLMLPLYWLVSWLTEKYIERERKKEE